MASTIKSLCACFLPSAWRRSQNEKSSVSQPELVPPYEGSIQKVKADVVSSSSTIVAPPSPGGSLSAFKSGSESLSKAERQSMLKQAKLLVRELADPADLLAIHRESMLELTTIRTLLDLQVFQHVPQSGSITLADLSQKTKTSPALLKRLLRMVVAGGILSQLPDSTYAHTKFSRAYAANPGPGMAFRVFYDECFLPSVRLHEYLDLKGRIEPQDQKTSPCLWSNHAEGLTHWEFLTTQPERYSRFQKAMEAGGRYYPGTGYYDFASLRSPNDHPDRPLLVDVGGGNGHLLNQILNAHPEISPSQLILQDLPEVINEAKSSGSIPPTMRTSAYDYNAPQPIKGAKSYLFRRVFHSESDTSALSILRTNVIPALAPDSLILIQDIIMPDTIHPGDTGAATADLSMLAVAGKERTVDDFKNLLGKAGLEVTGVFRAEMGYFGMIEARLAGSK